MKKKLRHIWFYYRWYLVAGAAVLLILVNFWNQKRHAPNPDYYVSIVTGTYVSEEVRNEIAGELADLWEDRNGDGQTIVTVNLYQYNGHPEEAEDTAAFMAAAVQLAADLQERISVCYITDHEELVNSEGVLTRLGNIEDSRLADAEALGGFCLLCFDENAPLVNKIMN